MKIAIPLSGGNLSAHFGHCERFAMVTAHPDSGQILSRDDLVPPPHEPGLFPAWLATQGATHVIAGGMGQSARSLFEQNKIEVILGAPVDAPERIVTLFFEGRLESGENSCDH